MFPLGNLQLTLQFRKENSEAAEQQLHNSACDSFDVDSDEELRRAIALSLQDQQQSEKKVQPATAPTGTEALADLRRIQQDRYRQHQQTQKTVTHDASTANQRPALKFDGSRFYTNKLDFATGDGNRDALNFSDLVDAVRCCG